MSNSNKLLVTGVILVGVLFTGACSSSNTPGLATPGSSGSAGASAGGGGSSAPPAVQIDITPAGDNVSPTTPIVVKANGGALQNVTVTNAAKGSQVKGTYSGDKSSWTSSEPLAYNASYNVAASAATTDGRKADQSSTVKTLAPKATAFPSFIPPPSVTDVGVGQPIVVKFDKDIDHATAEKALKVTSTPNQPGNWYWVSKREVHYRPQAYWQAGTTIKVHAGVYGVDLGGGVFGDTDRDLTLKVHDSWVAKADGNTEQMQIFQNGTMVKQMNISMGKDATPTHMGAHVISDKQRDYTMDSCTYGVCPPDPKAYRSVEHFAERMSNDGEFVHENPNSVGAQGHANVSHGCINLNAADAEWFFNHLGLGDVVEVTNSGGPALPIYDTYGDWAVSWANWQAGSALK